MADDARIGYMPARVWGCPTTAMWVYRLGAERAKRMLLTGDTIDGRTAADWGLVLESVPAAELDARVEALADRIAGVPINQLVMQKLMINQAYDNMGLHGTQILATLFDGITRHSPEGRWFQQFAATHGLPGRRQVARLRSLDPRRRRADTQPRRPGQLINGAGARPGRGRARAPAGAAPRTAPGARRSGRRAARPAGGPARKAV